MMRLLRHLVGTLLLTLMLVPFAFFFPALFVLAPKNPDARVLIFFAAPLSAGVVTLIYSHRSSVHAWYRMAGGDSGVKTTAGLFEPSREPAGGSSALSSSRSSPSLRSCSTSAAPHSGCW